MPAHGEDEQHGGGYRQQRVPIGSEARGARWMASLLVRLRCASAGEAEHVPQGLRLLMPPTLTSRKRDRVGKNCKNFRVTVR